MFEKSLDLIAFDVRVKSFLVSIFELEWELKILRLIQLGIIFHVSRIYSQLLPFTHQNIHVQPLDSMQGMITRLNNS